MSNISLIMVWAGQLVSAIGASMTAFAISVWAFESTGKALVASSIILARFLPMVVLSPLAGIIVDRQDKKKLLLIAEILLLINTFVLFYLFMVESINLGTIIGPCCINALTGLHAN